MARSRRAENLTLNFDSLTDTVTSLSGTLVLVVVLVLGVTNAPRESGISGNAEVDGLLQEIEMLRVEIQTINGMVRTVERDLSEMRRRLEQLRKDGASQSMRLFEPAPSGTALAAALLLVGAQPASPAAPPPAPVVVDLETAYLAQHLQLVIQESAAELQDLETRVPPLQREVDELLKEVEQLRLVEKKPEPAQAPEPEKVVFRPPLEEFTSQRALIFSCREGEIDFVDLDVVNREIGRLLRARDPQTTRRQPLAFDLPGSGSRCRGSISGQKGAKDFEIKVIVEPKPGARGETVEEIRRPDSRFRAALARWSPRQRCVNFGVWPDSYAEFRQAREIAWKAGYDVGWVPMHYGERAELGKGPNRIY